MKILFCIILIFSSLSVFAGDTLWVDSSFVEKINLKLRIGKVGEQFGVVNDTGKVVLPFQYETIQFVAPVDSACALWNGILKIQKDHLFALAEASGRAITPLQYEEIEFLMPTCHATTPRGLVMRVRSFGKFGLIDAQGNLLIRPSYNKIDMLADEKGRIFMPEVARVNKNGKFGFMNLQTTTVLPSNFDAIEYLCELKVKDKKQVFLKIRIKDKWGITNLATASEAKFEFEEIKPYDQQTALALVKKDKKYGFIDTKGVLKIDAEYAWAESFRNGVAVVQKGKYGLLLPTGKWAINPSFDQLDFATPASQVSQVYTSLLLAKKGDKYGVINTAGKEILKFEYENIRFDLSKNSFEIKKDGKTDWIRLD